MIKRNNKVIKNNFTSTTKTVFFKKRSSILSGITDVFKYNGLSEDFFNDFDNSIFQDFGFLKSCGDGIAKIYGLSGVAAGEFIFLTNIKNTEKQDVFRAMVLNLEHAHVGAVIFGNDRDALEGLLAYRTYSIATVNVGDFLLGRVVDALGLPIDGKGAFVEGSQNFVEKKAPGIILRQSVVESLYTGILAVDSLVPIGRGQRELIIGDRKSTRLNSSH